ncbi:hypothetical protein DL96DRAFT_1597248 [Flagelloscypha sp. PMI_526]|nr:hypothetical protein DL96DRAFT_1597248 [Flagelloscypha sp. PMI_526]
MAYVSVDSDDRIEEGPGSLQFKSFLGSGQGTGVGNADRGYLTDQPGQRKSGGGFWTVEYYQSYFDVDTQEVLRRCYSTMLPTSTDYLSTHLNPPDLYGPFWTLTTLVFTLFLSSSLAASISSYLSDPESAFDYDFQLLSIAVSVVYVYGIGVPFLLWLALRYLGVGEWSVIEAIALWGYAQFVWIPVSILCVIHVDVLRWALVVLGFGLSGYFLTVNIYPILASAEAKAVRLVIIVLAVLHAAIALTFKIMFFSYFAVKNVGPDLSVPGLPNDTPPEGTNSTVARWLIGQ